MIIIAIQFVNTLSIRSVDVMIVSRKMPENKTPKALELSTKCSKNKTHPIFQNF
jgi:hypothetical protein